MTENLGGYSKDDNNNQQESLGLARLHEKEDMGRESCAEGALEKENERLKKNEKELLEKLEFITNCFEWGCSPSGKNIAIDNSRALIMKIRGGR